MKLQHFSLARARPAGVWVTIAVVLLSGLTWSAPPTLASSGGQTADQVAQLIVAVQAKADAAATAWSELDDKSRQLATDIFAAQAVVDRAAIDYQAAQAALTQIAVARFTGSMPSVDLSFSQDPLPALQTSVLSEVAIGVGAFDLDRMEAIQADLAAKQKQLAALKHQNEVALQKVGASQQKLDDQLAQLQALEVQLKDAEVKKAYEAKLAALRQQEADAKAAKIAAADRAAAASTSSISAPKAVSRVSGSGASTPVAGPKTTVPGAVPPAKSTPTSSTSPTSTDAPVALQPPPTPAASPPVVKNGLICPVAGPNAFGDTWGDPRPGGRHHEGVDMMSPFGTPLVAVAAGVATMKTNALGGNTVGLKANDGTYYYYAHLSSWEGSTRPVQAGDVIGRVGHTGDTTANHLHFEIHPGGGSAVDPYPTVRNIC